MTPVTPERSQPKAPYQTPLLARLGAAVELTKSRAMIGAMDGGANNSRTG